MPSRTEEMRRYRELNPERIKAIAKRGRDKADPVAVKDYQLRVKFGITFADYKRMYEEQGGVCAICQGPERVAGRDLAVDHCHATGTVRGLLCSHCNRAVGLLSDDRERMTRAALYLLRES